ncbi:isoprenylcysteine carboxylmethyltransferase family protein [soil metagenome]
MIWFAALIVLVGAERLLELVVSRRNTAWSLAQGGREHGAGHYPVMVLLHVGLLVGALVEVGVADRPFLPLLGWSMLALVAVAQALRWWCIGTLGRHWSTRVLVVPGMRLVAAGPYRLLRHPNYLAVVVEGVALPLVHSAWLTAIVFTAANLALLAHRIRVEEASLRAASTREVRT